MTPEELKVAIQQEFDKRGSMEDWMIGSTTWSPPEPFNEYHIVSYIYPSRDHPSIVGGGGTTFGLLAYKNESFEVWIENDDWNHGIGPDLEPYTKDSPPPDLRFKNLSSAITAMGKFWSNLQTEGLIDKEVAQ